MDNQIFYLGESDEYEIKYFVTCLNGAGYVIRNPFDGEFSVLGTILYVRRDKITYQETIRVPMKTLNYPVGYTIYCHVKDIYANHVTNIINKGDGDEESQ